VEFVKTMNAKEFNLKIKHGWDASDFAQKYGIPEEKFLEILDKTFGRKAAEGMKKDLKRNQRRKLKRRQNEENPNEINIQQEELQTEQAFSENFEEIQTTEIISEKSEIMDVVETVEIKDKEKNNLFLNELNEKSDKTRNEVCEAEALRAKFLSERAKLKVNLQKEDEELSKLQETIKIHKEKITNTINELYKIDNSIDEVNEQISLGKRTLDAIAKEIDALKKVSIYVYENGDIDAENEIDGKVEIIIPETWEKIYQEIRETECVEDITVKQIKLIAKLISFVKTLESFEISFEIDTLQKIFEILYKMTEETA